MIQPLLLLIGTLALCAAVYSLLRRRQILDIPNARSSHSLPTPKGGGLGFMPLICLYTGWQGVATGSPPLLALGLATAVLVVMGLMDDLRDLSARLRFGVQTVLAVVLVALIFRDSPLPQLGLAALAVLFLLWLTNLYNFMDGIDGIACLQGILCGGLIAGLALAGVYPGQHSDLAGMVALCCLAFGAFNFPPARMFMGDTGSAALGFVLGGLALGEFAGEPTAFWLWVIALAGFVGDASATLAVRFVSGQRIYQAHRSHLYQLYTQHRQDRLVAAGVAAAAARTRAHRRTLAVFTAIFLLWQLPIAIAVARHWLPGVLGAAVALTPLLLAAVYLGAGRNALRGQGAI